MKKLKLLLILTMISALHSVAGPTIVNKGRNNLCMYVVKKPDGIECLGHGSTVCPNSWETVSYRGVSTKGIDIINYVTQQIERGEKSGSGEVNTIAFKWEADDEGYTIWLDSEKLIYPEDEK